MHLIESIGFENYVSIYSYYILNKLLNHNLQFIIYTKKSSKIFRLKKKFKFKKKKTQLNRTK